MARSRSIPTADTTKGIPLDRYGRKRIDGRSPEAKAAGVRGARFDAFGNIVGGTYQSDGVVNPRVVNGKLTGDRVDAGDSVKVPVAPTGLDRRASGDLTPRLNAFEASQPAKERQGSGVGFPSKADPRLEGTKLEFDPRLGGDLKAGTVPSEVQAKAGEVKTAMDASTRKEAWGQRVTNGPAWQAAVAAAKAKKETPVPGANAFMQNKLDVGRARVQMESRGELASQRYANHGTSSDPAIQAQDKKTLASTGTVAVDPKYAGYGQLTTAKGADGAFVRKDPPVKGLTKTADASARPSAPTSSLATSPVEKNKRKNAFGPQSFSLS